MNEQTIRAGDRTYRAYPVRRTGYGDRTAVLGTNGPYVVLPHEQTWQGTKDLAYIHLDEGRYALVRMADGTEEQLPTI